MIAIKPSGVKMHVAYFEEVLKHHELIRSVLIGNFDFREPIALIEAFELEEMSCTAQHQRFLECIWTAFEVVNRQCNQVARIARARTVIASRPFVRTPKGSVDRWRTLELFESEMLQVYECDNEFINPPRLE